MRNQFRKLKNVNCANSISLKQTILGMKCAERSDKHFEPTTFERWWDMNVNLYKVVQYPTAQPITKHTRFKKKYTTHSFAEF